MGFRFVPWVGQACFPVLYFVFSTSASLKPCKWYHVLLFLRLQTSPQSSCDACRSFKTLFLVKQGGKSPFQSLALEWSVAQFSSNLRCWRVLRWHLESHNSQHWDFGTGTFLDFRNSYKRIYRVRRTKLHSMEKTPVVVRAIAGVAAVQVRNHEMDI